MLTLIRSLVLALGFASCSVAADSQDEDLRFAGIFTDHAVLQRDQPIPVWGFATPGAEVQVRFAENERSTVTDPEGRWRVDLPALAAREMPTTLSATSEGATVTLIDVLVGEVWLCSGQSNMAMIVDRAKDPEKEKAEAALPGLRLFAVNREASSEPLPDLSGEWIVSSPETAGRFSATAFFFGREIHREVGVPVGLIVSAWSGSSIEAWTSREVQAQEPALEALLADWQKKGAAYTPEKAASEAAAYEAQLAEWRPRRDAAIKAGTEKPRPPRRPLDPRLHHHHPAVLFNGMIAPLVPYGIRGAIWYQGETNGLTTEMAERYRIQLPMLVNDWRARWDQGDFPMAWIQLPTVSARQVDWAPVREAMRLTQKALPHTGMAVTLDLGEERLLHPLNKQAFAHRLALWARAQVYGEAELPWSGPVPMDWRSEKGSTAVTFEAAAGGLVIAEGKSLSGFEVRDDAGEWQEVTARIEGDQVRLAHPNLSRATGVRYAWGNHPEASLFDAAGLPATPFQLGTEKEGSGQATAAPTPAPAPAASAKRIPAPPTKPPLDPVEIGTLPEEMKRLDLYLLLGQSNMKGRGSMPEEPLRHPQIVMMHKTTDRWFLARHPLHLVGDPETFEGHDNAGVGPGLAFAQLMAKADPEVRIGLIPCAVGGTRIGLWQPGARRYEDAIRRAKLALEHGPEGKTRIAGVLWLQGESDSQPERVSLYADALHRLVDGLRSELEDPELPFVAATIGEWRSDLEGRKAINEILLDLPDQRPITACVDARDLEGHIGDLVHFDTATQEAIGRRFAIALRKIRQRAP